MGEAGIREALFWALRLVGIILVGVFAIWCIRLWLRRPEGGSTGGEMTSFRELFERGELSQEEYDRVRSRLGKRMREELDRPRKPEKTLPDEPPFPGKNNE